MATNLAIDDTLLEDAQKIGGHRTKEAAVNEALREYIQHQAAEDPGALRNGGVRLEVQLQATAPEIMKASVDSISGHWHASHEPAGDLTASTS